ncbi:MAG: type III-A CRISPR-associated protein Cas10/Csm1 [Methanosarcinales archaeon]
MTVYNTLILGALLHNISEDIIKDIPLPEEVNKDLLLTLISKYQDFSRSESDYEYSMPEGQIRDLSLIIAESDSISSAIELEREKEEFNPLIPIFSEIDIFKGTLPQEDYYYLPQPLSLDIPFPKNGARDINEINDKKSDIWTDFNKEIKKIQLQNFNAFFETLYFLVEKYTSILSFTTSNPEISLFDNLKTTTAIASCLYNYHSYNDDFKEESIKDRSTTKFLLISGDISGIQNFIYNVKSPQYAQEGMSKRLRGRSFFMSLLTDTFSHFIIDELELPITNLLWCGGGNFFILAPCTKEVCEKVLNARQTINKYLLKEFQGEMYIAIESASVSGEDLSKNFSEILKDINYKLSLTKNKKYSELFRELGKKEVFGSFPLKKDVCRICGKDIDTEECPDCEELHESIGGKLPKTDYLVEIKTSKKVDVIEGISDVKFTEFNLYWKLVNESEIKAVIDVDLKSNKKSIDHIIVYKLNNTDFISEEHIDKTKEIPIAYGFKFLGNTAPVYEKKLLTEKILSFDNIAELGEGTNLLGILRMDVDDLGAIFSIGLPQKNRSISGISTLSRMLDLFFLGYLNKITKKYKLHPEICEDCRNKIKQSNYKLRALEIEIYEEENKNKLQFYEVKNPDGKYDSSILCDTCKQNYMSKLYITYSGGDDVFLVGPWDDIVEVAYDIQEKFKAYTCNNPNITISAGIFMSKGKFPIGRSADLAGEELDDKAKKAENKNAICVFGEVADWKDFKELKEIGDYLLKKVKDKKLSRSMVHYLLNLHDQYFITENQYKFMWLPKLLYVVKRNLEEDELATYFLNTITKNMPKITIPASWVSLKARRDINERQIYR